MITNKNNRIFPLKGNSTDLFERLIGYIDPIDPEWKEKLIPVNNEKIMELKQISGMEQLGLDFPPDYLVYLTTMGFDDNGLLERQWDGSDVDINSIIDYYKNPDDPDYYDDSNYFYLTFSSHWTEASLSMNLLHSENPEILLFNKEYFSESFEYYLFQQAFKINEEKWYPHFYEMAFSANDAEVILRIDHYKDNPNTIKKYYDVERLSEKIGFIILLVENFYSNLGFEKLWFSDTINYCAVKRGCSVFAKSSADIGNFNIYIYGNTSVIYEIIKESDEKFKVPEHIKDKWML